MHEAVVFGRMVPKASFFSKSQCFSQAQLFLDCRFCFHQEMLNIFPSDSQSWFLVYLCDEWGMGSLPQELLMRTRAYQATELRAWAEYVTHLCVPGTQHSASCIADANCWMNLWKEEGTFESCQLDSHVSGEVGCQWRWLTVPGWWVQVCLQWSLFCKVMLRGSCHPRSTLWHQHTGADAMPGPELRNNTQELIWQFLAISRMFLLHDS